MKNQEKFSNSLNIIQLEERFEMTIPGNRSIVVSGGEDVVHVIK